jgi:Ca-activated chloride channel homolog
MAHAHRSFLRGLFASSVVALRCRVGAWTRRTWASGRGARRMRPLALGLALALAVLAGGASAQVSLEVPGDAGPSRALPVVSEQLDVEIDQQHATTTFRQVFRNDTDRQVEALYALHAGEDATAIGYWYYNGETKIVGEVFERQEARAMYEDVTGLGRDPGLLEKDGEGVFSFRVFPVEPGEHKRVGVTLARLLPRRDRTVEYRAPLGSPAAAVTVSITDDRPIGAVTSPTHAIAVDRSGPRSVRVTSQGARGVADAFVLRYAVEAEPWALSVATHQDPGEPAYFTASVAAPDLEGARVPRDVTLVIDRSGSMAGESIASARRAAQQIIARLGSADRVNVIAFDDDVEPLFDRPRTLTPDVRRQADGFVARIRDAGGTDIARALAATLQSQVNDDQPDVVFFLTDGQSDARAALEVARTARTNVRLFTVGIGTGVDRALLSRLATEFRGRFTFVPGQAALESSLLELYAQIEEPVLTDVTLEVEGARVSRVYPRALPDLFRHGELRLAGRAEGAGPARLVLKGRYRGREVRMEHALPVGKTASRPWVGRTWALARVADLEQESKLAGETEELKTEMVSLGLAYDIVTAHTAFLAMPESEMTDRARGLMASARERKRRILAAHPDAAQLSRAHMPPGDPELSVRAPPSARQVTAYFPFGLVEDLAYDGRTERWTVRFLVPKDVPDGTYPVRVVIVEADGTVRRVDVPYVIDSQAPELDVDLDVRGRIAVLTVRVSEPAREVRVQAGPGRAVLLRRLDGGRRFVGNVPLARGTRQLRVVAADRARNEAIVTVDVAGAR